MINLYTAKFFSPKEIQMYFSADKVQRIAERLEGFSGRTIFQMINSINNKKFTTPDGKMTGAIIEQKIDQFVSQHEEMKKREGNYTAFTPPAEDN